MIETRPFRRFLVNPGAEPSRPQEGDQESKTAYPEQLWLVALASSTTLSRDGERWDSAGRAPQRLWDKYGLPDLRLDLA